jgi:SAM-dependent methyltransferase
MKAAFAPVSLRCPVCGRDRTLVLAASQTDEREVREGALTCSACASTFPVHRGVAHLLHNAPDHVLREAAGLERFAEFMRNTGWDRDRIRQLPQVEDGYWFVQTVAMRQLLETVDFRPGQTLLDVGSNTCWAANRFAVEGLAVTALDISTAELQGLYTADYFIENGASYFERVLGSMNDMPIASGSLDYVYCCEVLHHNDAEGLRRTMDEVFRVLKPGGRLLVVNETLKTLNDPHGVHIERVAHWEGYEHAHWAARYRWEAVRAGFRTQLLEPRYHAFFGDGPPGKQLRPPRRRPGLLLRYGLRSHRLSRRAYLNWLLQVSGDIAFAMIATKPARRRVLSLAARRAGGSPRV